MHVVYLVQSIKIVYVVFIVEGNAVSKLDCTLWSNNFIDVISDKE